MKHLYLYCIAFLVFLVIDGIWLGLVAPRFYRRHLGHILADNFKVGPAVVFYLLFVAGLVLFVIQPAIEGDSSLLFTLLRGGFFGLVTYATYDLTNQATVKNWPLVVTVVDLAWGTFLSATVCTITVFLGKKLLT